MGRFLSWAGLGLVALSGLVYWGAFELQHALFAATEHVPGINWLYIPSGIRVVLVLVAGVHAALGIALATLMIEWTHYQHITGWAVWLTAFSSGFSAYLALLILRSQGKINSALEGLNASMLLTYSVLYSLINAVMHHVSWRLTHLSGDLDHSTMFPMFVGDLLGAVVSLVVLKWAFSLKPTS